MELQHQGQSLCLPLLDYTYLRSITKQVVPNYVTFDCLFQMETITFFKRVSRGERIRPIRICWALNKEASGTIFMTSLILRGRESNPPPLAHWANTLPLSHRCGNYLCCPLQRESGAAAQAWESGSARPWAGPSPRRPLGSRAPCPWGTWPQAWRRDHLRCAGPVVWSECSGCCQAW